jgi:hypothetical protein
MLRKLAFLSLSLVLLISAAGSVWAAAMDCCDRGYAACLSEQTVCPSCFAAAPALPAGESRIFQAQHLSLLVPVALSLSSHDEKLIWKPPRNAVFTV